MWDEARRLVPHADGFYAMAASALLVRRRWGLARASTTGATISAGWGAGATAADDLAVALATREHHGTRTNAIGRDHRHAPADAAVSDAWYVWR
jgi:hypothetical protein